jgi:hypothetical protein
MISLSDPVDPGTRIWYSATLPSDVIGYLLADIPRLLGDVTSYLASNYSITVESSNHTAGLLGASVVTLVLYVNASYGQLSDVQKVIDDAFYNAGGVENRVQVQSSSITKVQYPGDTIATATGAPGPSQQVVGSGTASGVPDPNAPSVGVLTSLWDATLGGLFSGSLSITGWVSIVAIAVFAILVVGVILSPTTAARVTRSFAKR